MSWIISSFSGMSGNVLFTIKPSQNHLVLWRYSLEQEKQTPYQHLRTFLRLSVVPKCEQGFSVGAVIDDKFRKLQQALLNYHTENMHVWNDWNVYDIVHGASIRYDFLASSCLCCCLRRWLLWSLVQYFDICSRFVLLPVLCFFTRKVLFLYYMKFEFCYWFLYPHLVSVTSYWFFRDLFIIFCVLTVFSKFHSTA